MLCLQVNSPSHQREPMSFPAHDPVRRSWHLSGFGLGKRATV